MKKNIIIILIIFSLYTQSYPAINGVLLKFAHENILEKQIPEYKKFNEDYRKLYKKTAIGQKNNTKQQVKQLGNNLINLLNNKLNAKNLTAAQKNNIRKTIKNVKNKLAKI